MVGAGSTRLWELLSNEPEERVEVAAEPEVALSAGMDTRSIVEDVVDGAIYVDQLDNAADGIDVHSLPSWSGI